MEGSDAQDSLTSVPVEGLGAYFRCRRLRQDSPNRHPSRPHPRKNSPGRLQNTHFGPISPRWANFFAPTLLIAPLDETVNTNAGTSGRLHETHDAFAQ